MSGYDVSHGTVVTSFWKGLRAVRRSGLVPLAVAVVIGILSFLSLGCPAASGQALTWDPSGLSSNFGGGGLWDPNNQNWWNGTSTVTWTANDAWFTTTGGSVTVDAPYDVGNLVFTASGYVLSGSTLTIPAGTITVNQNATINSNLVDYGSGLTFLGPGLLTLGAAGNTGVVGIVTVNGGTLVVNGTSQNLGGLGAASSIVINSGATVLTAATASYNSLIGSSGNATKTIRVNQGGLLTNAFATSDHLNALLLDGGTVSATGGFENTYGNWNFDGGVSTAGDGQTSYMLGGNAVLTQNSNGGTQFNIGAGDTLNFGTTLSLVSSLTFNNLVKAGPGTLVLTASNNFNSTTVVNAGTLLLANTAALLASPLNISAGTVGFSGITRPVPLLSLAGNGGTLLLTNTNGSPVNLSVGGGGASTTYSGTLTGSGGSLTIAGGNLTLGGNNNYTGPTILAGGVLTLGNPAALAGGGTIEFSGGTLQYSAAANGVDYSSSFGTATGQNAWNINTNGQNVTLAGNLAKVAGVLTKLGPGELTLTGSNQYTGSTNIDGGLLQFANGPSVPKFSTITINTGGALVASSGSANTVNGWLSLSPKKIQNASTGAIALTASSTDTTVNFTLGSGYANLSLGAVGTVTYNGTIMPGSGGYNLGGGGGTLWVTTQLTNTGGQLPTSLTVGNGGGGTVVLANSNDNWGGTTTIVPGATLQLGDGMANLVSPTGAITNSGTLIIPNSPSVPQTFSAGINGSGTLYAFGSSVLQLNGTNSTGIFYANGGTVNINGSFSTTGKTVFGTNLSSAPSGPTVVNWNATGTFAPANYVGIADTGRTATLNINGGSLNFVGAPVFVGNTNGGGNVGTLNMTAGTVTVDASNPFYIGGIGTGNTGSAGVLNISGGYMYIAQGGTFGPGDNDSITMAYGNTSTATINLTGGTLSTARTFYLGGAGSTATLNLNGGVLQCINNSTGNWFYNGVAVVAGTNGAFLDIEANQFAKVENGTGTTEIISGPGSLTKLGPGALYLYGANSYQGGTVVNNGQLAVTNEASLGPVPSSFVANNITLNGGELSDLVSGTNLSLSANRGVFLGPNGGYLSAGYANTTTVNGLISGGGPLTIANNGQGYPGNNVYLANPANSYSGSTTIGTPQLGGFLDFGALATLNVPKLAIGGSVSSIGQSTSAASNLVFNPGSGGTATMNYVGGGDSTDRLFTIASGINTVINSAGTGPLSFTNPGAIVFTNAQASTLILGGTYAGPTPNAFAPQITDNGALPTTLAVNGSVWTLTGSNNTYSGGTLLNGGTLQLASGNANALQNSMVTVNGGNLAFAAGVTSPAVAGLSGTGSGIVLKDANSSPVTLYVGGNGASSTFAGNLSGPGGLFKTGIGQLTITGSQSYTGSTVVNSGTLQLAPAPISGFGVNGTGWAFNKSATAAGVSNNVLTLTTSSQGGSGSSLWYLTPEPVTGGAWTATFAVNDVTGSGADGGAFVLQTAGTSALGGTGGQKGFGAGTLPNPNAGMVWELYQSSGTSFNTNSNTVAATSTTASGVNLRALNTPTTFTVSYNGNGTVTATLTQGSNIFGPVTYNVNLSSLLNSNLAYIGFVGSDGGTSVTQQVSNFNFQAVSGLSLNLLPTTAPMQINAGGTFDLNGGSQTIVSLSGLGTVTNSSTGYASVLTIGDLGTSPTFSGTITGNLSLIMAGSGVQTFSGSNSYTGGTTINGGDLRFTSPAALPTSGAITINTGGGLVAQGAYPSVNAWLSSGTINSASTGAILLAPGSTDTSVNFTTSPGYNTLSLGALGAVTYGGTITIGTNGYFLGGGGGTLTLVNAVQDVGGNPTPVTIDGPGQVVLRAAPTYTGNTTISGGVLDLGGHTFTTAATVAFQGGGLQDGAVVNNGAYTATTGGTVSAALEGAAALTMNGPGVLVLAATNNSYTGGTTLIGGALQATNTGALPGYNIPNQVTVYSSAALWLSVGGRGWSSPQIDVLLGAVNFSGGTLGMDTTAGNFSYNTAITQNLSLTSLGPNVLTLGGAENYSGATTVSAGTLAIGAAGSLGGGNYTNPITIAGGAALNYDGAAAQTLAGGIAGGGMLVKSGNGVLTIPVDSSYTGGTTVSAGTLAAASDAALSTSPVLLNPTAPASAQVQFTSNSPTIASFASSGNGAASAVLGNPGGGATTLTVGNGGTAASTYSGSISDLSSSGGGTGSLVLAGNGAQTLAGPVNLGGGVTVTGGAPSLAGPTNLAGSLAVTGGVLTLAGAVTPVGGATVSTGTLNVAPGGLLNLNGNLALASATASSVAVLNLNGGLLSVPGIAQAGNGNATLNLNGGTLQANAGNSTFLQQLNGGVNVQSATVIDTQSNTIQIGQSMVGNGGLTKVGAGTLVLAAPNTYAGGTTLTAGVLAATGPANLGTGTVTLSGGTLALQAASVPLSATGYNQNVVATQGVNIVGGNTGTIDGTYHFYAQGDSGAPNYTYGLPAGGGLMSLANSAVTFQLQPYTANNDLGMGTLATGTLTLANPAEFTQLSILATVGHGPATMNFTLNFADGSQSVQTYTASVPDWYGGSNYAALGLGRVGTTFDTATGSINPRLYEEDFTLAAADQTKVVDSITFSNGTSSGASRLNVMAISGSGPNVAQSYANAVNVTHNADIDVSQLLQAAIGPLTVNASTLRLSSADTSGSPYSLATPSISLAGNATVNAAPSAGGGAATLVLGTGQSAAIAVTSGGSNTITANVLLAGNVNVNAASGAALALGGNVTDGGAGYGLTLTGNGSGELILSGSNGYTGGTIVDEGTLLVTNPKALLAGSSLTVGASGTLLFDPSQGGSVVADSPAAAIVPEPSTSTLVSQQGIGAVPEPGTLALLAAGALAAGFAVWRGRRQ